MRAFVVKLAIIFLTGLSQVCAEVPAESVLAKAGVPQIQSNRSCSKIRSQKEFYSLARVYRAGTPHAIPNVMFVIDRQSNNQIYYINSNRDSFHEDFMNGTYLSFETGDQFAKNNYLDPMRRFILGTLAYQTQIKRWTFEFWEGDLISADLIKMTYGIINKTFFIPVAFKPNSLRQEELSANLKKTQRVLFSDILKNREYQVLNLASGMGRIRIIEKLDEHLVINSDEIVVLNEVPISLAPVSGIITTRPSTALSHINLLAKNWGVPNAYIKNAQELLKPYNGSWVYLETKGDSYTIKRADPSELKEYQNRQLAKRIQIIPRSDLSVRHLARLKEQHKVDAAAYGGKSANLGEIINAHLVDVSVPNGFSIPFYFYDQFIKENNLANSISAIMRDQRFLDDPNYRREQLAALRAQIQQGKVNKELQAAVLHLFESEYAGKGVFVRSSSNSEDLPNFSGAGLYTTMPNVKDPVKVIEAIKTVWASLWNFTAYEARQRTGIEHLHVFMGVIIQEGINAESSGVMITADPYNAFNNESKDAFDDAIYISAKKGLGAKVVEGKEIAEQILFNPQSNAMRVLTRSGENTLLTFDMRGGLEEVSISGDSPEKNVVLTDELAQRLTRAATKIKGVFGGQPQDIEWAYEHGQIFITQARPYLR